MNVSVPGTDASRENEVEKLLGHFEGVIKIPIESFCCLSACKALKSTTMLVEPENIRLG